MVAFAKGDAVRVGTLPDATVFEITKLLSGGGCFLRQKGTAPNGKPYAEQRSDLSLLIHVIPNTIDPLPNLDAMEPEELQAWGTLHRSAARYALQKRHAMRLRLAGKIKDATVAEEICDRIYNDIPKDLRW